MLDVCILGAGPAGLSAALWLHNLGLEPAIFDCAPQPGGAQRLNFLSNDWVLGADGLTGPQLAERFVAHVRSLAIALEPSAQPVGLKRATGGFAVDFVQRGVARSIAARALLVATGTHYRGSEVLAGVDGFNHLEWSTLAFGPYAFADLDSRRGQRILIIGGGDNAFENARRLLGVAAAITLVARSRPRAQAKMIAVVHEAQTRGQCDVLLGARVEAVGRGTTGLVVTVSDQSGRHAIECDRIHVLAGYEPNTAFLDPLVAGADLPPVGLDGEGYIQVDARMATSCPGIYAAGDVCNRLFPSVVSAIGQGAAAAKAIEADLASAP
jgi:thioredoxin reductase (NADPH)